MGYEAFMLDRAERTSLMERFPPVHPDVIAHHITHRFCVKGSTQPYGSMFRFEVVGYAKSDTVEALVVRPRGASERRMDGKVYHITWSINRSAGAKPKDSNDLVQAGYYKVDPPIPLLARFEYIE